MSNEKEPLVNLQLAIEHGLTGEEYNRILEIIGRTPTYTELGIFSVLWSEHCSYKNSIALIKTLPRSGGRLLVTAGEENAGLVDIGNGLAVCFKIESHNHPSAIEPYQGAATGVGGIMRDIFTMGARPIAALNSLRFGNPNDPRVKYLIKGIVKGIGDYGNCFGVPTVAGEVFFDECYTDNPIVNAMAVGIVEHNAIMKAAAKGEGNPVMIVGSATGRDGIHGATFASQEISEDSEEKRPSVQVGDPFTEKLLLEATLEAAKTGYIVGIQDMGAAGIACSTSEMSARGNSGMKINLDKVPTRETGMTAYEIMLSESQERMLVVVKKGYEIKIQEIFEKWDLHGKIIGEVTDSDILRVYKDGILKSEIPAESLVLGGGVPVYYRQSIEPKYLSVTRNFSPSELPQPENYNEILKEMLESPNICSKKWVFQQYDTMVRTNSIQSGISDAAIVRIKGTNKALALKTDGNARYVYLNPRKGAEIAVAESARNVICCGAKPIAITNCLNFGNPYNPENYWQFKEAVAGIGNACRVFDTPVTGGNVSFYNESPNYSVFPTPVIGMLGLIEDIKYITTMEFKNEGDLIILIGQNREDISGSEYLKHIHKKTVGDAPYFEIEYEKKIQTSVLEAIQSKIIKSAHDISDGGIAITLAECCIASNLGAIINFEIYDRFDFLLFGEDQMRIVVTIEKHNLEKLKYIVEKNNSNFQIIGKVAEKNLIINSEIDISVEDLKKSYYSAMENIIEGKK